RPAFACRDRSPTSNFCRSATPSSENGRPPTNRCCPCGPRTSTASAITAQQPVPAQPPQVTRLRDWVPLAVGGKHGQCPGRSGRRSFPPAVLRKPTSPLCASCSDKRHRRRFERRGGALQDLVKIGRASSSYTPLTRDVFGWARSHGS